MQNKLILPALEGYVLLDDKSVALMSGDELVLRLSVDEWEALRQDLRLDDTVKYECGETPMTVLQFQTYVEMARKIKDLKSENDNYEQALR